MHLQYHATPTKEAGDRNYRRSNVEMPKVIIDGPKLRGDFVSRPNRFLVLVRIDHNVTPCYLPDPGRLKELLQPGVELLVRRPSTGVLSGKSQRGINGRGEPEAKRELSKRKTEYDVYAVILKDGETERLVSVDSRLPNRLVFEALLHKKLKEFREYDEIRPEFNYGSSRLDFMLDSHQSRGKKRCLLEVKSCNLCVNGVALFPDAPTERGRRHVEELIRAKDSGEYDRASILFIVQRDDAQHLEPYRSNDPKFSEALHNALCRGVEVYAYTAKVSEDEVTLSRSIPVSV
jgi:sugar fermentation stimulation protein A